MNVKTTYSVGFESSFDDSFLGRLNKTSKDEENKNEGAGKDGEEESEDSNDDAFTDNKKQAGKVFLEEVLPKLPTLANGMRLLGVNEYSELIDSNEVFKLRVFRPDYPIETSDVFEDNCSIRLTNHSRLITDDLQVAKFKLEVAVFRVGLAENDALGPNALERLYEAEDLANLTFAAFMERKTKGKNRCNAIEKHI